MYRHNGVREYVVHRVLDGEIDWYLLRGVGIEPGGVDEHPQVGGVDVAVAARELSIESGIVLDPSPALEAR